MIEIKSSRLVLRLSTLEDSGEIFACITPTLTRYMSWEPARSFEEFKLTRQKWQTALENGTDYHFVVRLAVDNGFVGVAGVHEAHTPHPELGLWVREELHNRGFGRQIIGAVAAWATQTLNVEYFVYPVAVENIASRRIAEAYGGVVHEQQSTPKYEKVVYHIPPVK